MKQHPLAVPASVLLVFAMLLPVCAQTAPDNPEVQAPGAAQANQPRTISDEDLARLYLVRKQYREAQDLLHKLTMEQPKNAVYWTELGISFHNQERLDAALKCYQRSAKLDKNYPDALNNIGTIYYERKKYVKAIRSYDKAIAIRNDYAPFYLNLGYAYFGDKRYSEAITAFRKALQIDPESFDPVRAHAGTVLQDRTIGTDRARFYFLLAKSFAEAGNVERCVIYLKKARDEGFKEMDSAKSDPSFAGVIRDPAVQEVLVAKAPEPEQP